MPKLRPELIQPVTDFMKSRNLWADDLLAEIPVKCENYDGFLLFNHPAFLDKRWKDAGDELWQLICRLWDGTKIALKGRIQNDDFRSPKVEVVYGDSPIARFVDNGIKYSWNVEKNMFCSGNVTERHRIGSLNCENDVIVDLFAGIGYFTLPYLVHAKARMVHACEWNPFAVEYLKRNLVINKVDSRCIIYEGDNREHCPQNIANRVNLGLIPTAEPYWETACRALLLTGGLLYVHENVTSKVKGSAPLKCLFCENWGGKIGGDSLRLCLKEFSMVDGKATAVDLDDEFTWKFREWFDFSIHLSHRILELLANVRKNQNWKVCVTAVFKVKQYAPHIHHLVYTVKCTPTDLFPGRTGNDLPQRL